MSDRLLINVDDPYEELFEMANLVPKKTGLKAGIWSEHSGILRNKKDKSARIKIAYGVDYSVSVSIEKSPRILSISSKLKSKREGSSEWKAIKDAIEYVGKYYKIFLKHYNDVEDKFDDEDLFKALRDEGAYK